MRFASLGSGSKGNATLVASDSGAILIDCGFSMRKTLARLASVGMAADDLDAILVTHEHGDHVRGVAALCRRFGVPVYATRGTIAAVSAGRHALQGCEVHSLEAGRAFRAGPFRCLPVPVPHDAREPCQYVLEADDRRLGVLTDLGSLTPAVVASYAECDALMLEANHDLQLLQQGPYPPPLKRRVGGALGHLSNAQSATLLSHCNVDRLQHLVLSHLSEQNNTPGHALAAVHAVVEHGQERIQVASQHAGVDWLELV